MKKLNWGHGIVLSFVVFAVGTFSMVFIALTTRVDLVTDDYYEKELIYQRQIESMNNTKNLEKGIIFTYHDGSIFIHYPILAKQNDYIGTVHFFRPSDRSFDFTHEVVLDSAFVQKINTADLLPGLWRLKIEWSVETKKYYYERPVFLQ